MRKSKHYPHSSCTSSITLVENSTCLLKSTTTNIKPIKSIFLLHITRTPTRLTHILPYERLSINSVYPQSSPQHNSALETFSQTDRTYHSPLKPQPNFDIPHLQHYWPRDDSQKANSPWPTQVNKQSKSIRKLQLKQNRGTKLKRHKHTDTEKNDIYIPYWNTEHNDHLPDTTRKALHTKTTLIANPQLLFHRRSRIARQHTP